jgi:hypothetical protein
MSSLLNWGSRAFLATQSLYIIALVFWAYAFSQVPAELRGRGAWRLFLAACGKPFADVRPEEAKPLAVFLRRARIGLACFLTGVAIWLAWYVAYLLLR